MSLQRYKINGKHQEKTTTTKTQSSYLDCMTLSNILYQQNADESLYSANNSCQTSETDKSNTLSRRAASTFNQHFLEY
jgi:hypothetical protein